jgi:hypothetical protein
MTTMGDKHDNYNCGEWVLATKGKKHINEHLNN